MPHGLVRPLGLLEHEAGLDVAAAALPHVGLYRLVLASPRRRRPPRRTRSTGVVDGVVEERFAAGADLRHLLHPAEARPAAGGHHHQGHRHAHGLPKVAADPIHSELSESGPLPRCRELTGIVNVMRQGSVTTELRRGTAEVDPDPATPARARRWLRWWPAALAVVLVCVALVAIDRRASSRPTTSRADVNGIVDGKVDSASTRCRPSRRPVPPSTARYAPPPWSSSRPNGGPAGQAGLGRDRQRRGGRSSRRCTWSKVPPRIRVSFADGTESAATVTADRPRPTTSPCSPPATSARGGGAGGARRRRRRSATRRSPSAIRSAWSGRCRPASSRASTGPSRSATAGHSAA